MNEEIILGMARPYVRDSAMTYDEFSGVFSKKKKKEQYIVTDLLYKNGIDLVDRHIEDSELVLDIDSVNRASDDLEDEELEILYDPSLFQDRGAPEGRDDSLIVYKEIRQSNEILCSLIQQGDRQAVQDLCIKNKRLVDKYVSAYKKRFGDRLDFQDLEQVGFLGLIKAAQRFSIQQGTAFSTYAVFWIKQSSAREIMDNGYAIRIPVHMLERINKVVAIHNRLAGEGVPSHRRIPQIASETGFSDDEVRECLTLKANILGYTSLDVPIGEDGGTELRDLIPDEEEDPVERIVLDHALRRELEKIFATLSPRERDILKLRFGWDDDCPKTLEEISSEYHVTRERIRQIEAKAIKKMQHPSRRRRLDDFWEDRS